MTLTATITARPNSKRQVLGTVTNTLALTRKPNSGLKHSWNSGGSNSHNAKQRFHAIKKNSNSFSNVHHNNSNINIKNASLDVLAKLPSEESSHPLSLHSSQTPKHVTSKLVSKNIGIYSGHSNEDTEIESTSDYDNEDSSLLSIVVKKPRNQNVKSSGSVDLPSYKVTINRQCDTNPNALTPVWSILDLQIMAELEAEFRSMPGVFDEEDEDTYDISMAAEYSAEIFEYMRILELRYVPDAGYMARQPDITWRMRALLIDWMVRVHDHFNLLPETLFLTVNYIDRFLSLKTVSEQNLQLIGLVAMFVASKYEEITYPSVKEIAYIADNEYTVDEILHAEHYMIHLFEFNMGWPGPMSFLRRSSKADNYDSDVRTLAKYFLELTVMEPRLVSAPASWLAAAAHYLARQVLSRGSWSKAHTYFSGYTEAQLQPVVELISKCCYDPQTHHRSIFKKYSDARFRWVSVLVSNWIEVNINCRSSAIDSA